MENIFRNAKFGDKFKTRDGRCAIYLGWSTFDNEVWCRFISEDKEEFEILRSNGKARFDAVELDRDIVGKWKEPIDEEELTEMANTYMLHPDRTIESYALLTEMMEAFKAGYRKAKEE